MKTIEYRTLDRSRWAVDEWQNEPDKIQWEDEATKLPCLIVRNSMGHLCGYVGVPESHPLFGKDYREIEGIGIEIEKEINFSKSCTPDVEEESDICHIVEPGENDLVWWLGFDCAHFEDLIPSMHRQGITPGWATYKNIGFVKEQCRVLALQLTALTPQQPCATTSTQ